MRFNLTKRKLKLAVYVTICALYLSLIEAEGKAASRSGLVGVSTVGGGKFNQNKDSSKDKGHTRRFNNRHRNVTLTPAKRLKNDLLDNYDSSLMPVINHNHNIHVELGFTYRQVLNLDEKNQILKSLIWFRMKWKDENLKWNPDDYDGIEEFELPHMLLWSPDLVIYEEVGEKQYEPRLKKSKVKSDGTVSYAEPTEFQTTCSIDTAFFPFDTQVCHMTFVMWSQPITKIDLSSDRPSEKAFHDTKHYFINSGEWRLVGVEVNKLIRDYQSLLSTSMPGKTENVKGQTSNVTSNISYANDTSHSYANDTSPAGLLEGDSKHNPISEFPMDPLTRTSYVTLGNRSMTNDMYAEIKFTVVVRRNSSLYMQSMLFPSVLLTTVAVLGFYLPPDCGERIGLQITILLTFMVFLLAVGEMFPASTGPYLGVYFVVCMSLLGVNLIMTVVVLHLHFKPVVILDEEVEAKCKKHGKHKLKKKGRCGLNCFRSSYEDEKSIDDLKRSALLQRVLDKKRKSTSAIPKRLRRFLQCVDHYWTLKERGAKWLEPISDDEDDAQCFLDNDATVDDDSTDECVSFFGDARRESAWRDSRNEDVIKVEDEVGKSPSHHMSSITRSETEEITTSKNGESRPASNKNTWLELPMESHKRYSSRSRSESHLMSMCVEGDEKDEHATDEKPTRTQGVSLKHSLSSLSAPGLRAARLKRREEKNAKKKPTGSIAGSKSDNSDATSLLRYRVMGALGDLKGFIKKNDDRKRMKRANKKRREAELKRQRKEEEQERQDMEQEEWKSVARAIDLIFLRAYVIFIVISHISLFAVAMNTWFQDHNLNFLDYFV